MAKGYFQLFSNQQGAYLRIVRAGGSDEIDIQEIMAYLDNLGIYYDLQYLNKNLGIVINSGDAEALILISGQLTAPVNETYTLTVQPDKMTATVRFYPPSYGDDPTMAGKRIAQTELMRDLAFHKIIYGVKNEEIKAFFAAPRYAVDFVVAEGKAPRQGSNASIEYLFATQLSSKPTLNEDGSVDFFHLNNISHCRAGQELARLTPEDRGDPGTNVYGESLPPHAVKGLAFRRSKNVSFSEDKLSLIADVDGHVTFVDGNVFVANVYSVENVNSATGNIEFEGSVVVLGNVYTNFSVKAKGNIEVRGVVEGAAQKAAATSSSPVA